jgi:hypothetical protein
MSDHGNSLAAAPAPADDKGDEHMTSPSCVIDEGKTTFVEMEQQQLRLKENPTLIAPSFEATDIVEELSGSSFVAKAMTKELTFSTDVTEYEPSIVWDMEDTLAMWWTPTDIQTFHRTARAKAKAFLRRSQRFKDAFQAVFQECSKDISTRDLLETESVQYLLSSATTLRGLESRTISIIREYRNFHIQSVLGVAKNQTVNTSLRSRSLRTSKPSRILARVLAKQDAIAIAHMIQKELDGAPSSPPSSSDGTTSSEADATSAAASPFSMSSRHRDRFA